MSQSKPEPSVAFGRANEHKGMGLAAMLRETGATTTADPEPEPPAPVVAPAPPAAVKPRSEKPKAARPAPSKTSEREVPNRVRKSITAQVPAGAWEEWDELLVSTRLPWRSDATAAAIRYLMELPDSEFLDAVLTETAGERGLTRQLGARVETELYGKLTTRLERLGRLPINAALTAALRRVTAAGSDELQRRVLAERRPS